MFDVIYEWLYSLAAYLVLIEAVLLALPDSAYRKYVRFFIGMILVLMLLTPILRLFGKDGRIDNFYDSRELEKQIEEIENASEFLYEMENEKQYEIETENQTEEVEEIFID